MGNSASKAARTAAQASKRQYPTRIPPTPKTTASNPRVQAEQGPQVNTTASPSGAKTEEIIRDAFDPQLGAALRSLGPVKPTPTQSNSSTAQAQPGLDNGLGGNQPVFPDPKKNPSLLVIEARKRLAEEAESELEQYGRKGFKGKKVLDVSVIRQILVMRDHQGLNDDDIDQRLELYPGSAAKLAPGVFSTPDNPTIMDIRR